MISILDMLAQIRERPAVFLGRPSMRMLYSFLTGFTYARKDSGVDDFKILSGFGDFVHQRFHVTSSQSWAQIIEFYSTTDEYEMELFWKLLDQYLAKRAAKDKSKKKAPRDQAKKDVA